MYDIVFMGTPDFAVPALEALATDAQGRFRVILACTRPDAASSRGSTLLPSPVRLAAKRLGIPVATPASKSELAALPELVACDFIVVSAYGMVLTPEILSAPRFGVVNIHASLLPRWRGAAPIQRAILAGDEQTGVSIMRVVYELDAGAVCAQAALALEGLDAPALTEMLAQIGARLLTDTLPRIAGGQVEWAEQEPSLVTYAEKLTKAEVRLSPTLDVLVNIRRVRASTPQAPSRCTICGRGVTVLVVRDRAVGEGGPGEGEGVLRAQAAALPAQDALAAGQVFLEAGRLFLVAADGAFEVLALKPDGKQAMDAAAFAAGLRTTALRWEGL